MDTSPVLLLVIFVVGFVGGLLTAFLLKRENAKNAEQLAQEIFHKNEAALLKTVEKSFGSLSLNVLDKSTKQLLNMAETQLKGQTENHAEQLEKKKALIDQQLDQMKEKLQEVAALVKTFEESRAEKLGALSNELTNLTQTSKLLQQALGDHRARGQWGERIADDILKLAGFIEGQHYQKQMTTPGEKKSRPDFTFFLPNGFVLNMDSKFPLTNYLSYVQAESQTDKDNFRKKFLNDVRNRIKEIGERKYIGAEQNTIDCALIFIPNEQVYRFIYEEDSEIFDLAFEQKVVVCSPMNLFAVLAVIHQAVKNFRLEQSSREILMLLEEFQEKWNVYKEKMADVKKSLDKAQSTFDELMTTRQKNLEKPLSKIESLRQGTEVRLEKPSTTDLLMSSTAGN